MNGENLKGKKVENIRNILGKEARSESDRFKLSEIFDKENIDKRKLTSEKIQEAAKKVVGKMKEIKLDRGKFPFKKEETKETTEAKKETTKETTEENASEVEPKEGEEKKEGERVNKVEEKVKNAEEKVEELTKEKKEKEKKAKEEETKEIKLKRIGIILLGLIPMGILWFVKFCNWLAEKIMDSLENIAGSFK
jgi:Fe2+ transport system protein B